MRIHSSYTVNNRLSLARVLYHLVQSGDVKTHRMKRVTWNWFNPLGRVQQFLARKIYNVITFRKTVVTCPRHVDNFNKSLIFETHKWISIGTFTADTCVLKNSGKTLDFTKSLLRLSESWRVPTPAVEYSLRFQDRVYDWWTNRSIAVTIASRQVCVSSMVIRQSASNHAISRDEKRCVRCTCHRDSYRKQKSCRRYFGQTVTVKRTFVRRFGSLDKY